MKGETGETFLMKVMKYFFNTVNTRQNGLEDGGDNFDESDEISPICATPPSNKHTRIFIAYGLSLAHYE